MSSKSKSFTVTWGSASLLPKLRFPEFQKVGGWAHFPMGEVYSFRRNNSLSRDKLNYSSGSIRNIHYGDIHTKFSSHFHIKRELVPFVNEAQLAEVRDTSFCSEGDLIIADASEDLADIGKCIEIIDLNSELVVAGLHTILARPSKKKVSVGFGGHLFKSGSVRRQIQREAQGAKVLGISARRLQDIRIPLPSLTEQQKIAECLNSADALIEAQGRKVEALKAHKKGLMQQLFPQEGETQPRLRFPEFEGAREWEPRTVGSVCTSFSGGTPSTSNPDFYGGNIPFIRSAEIGKESTELFLTRAGLENSAAKMIKKDDVLVALYGANSGDVAIAKIDGAINQAILCLRPVGSAPFLCQFLTCRKEWIIEKYLQGGQGNLSGEIVKSVALAFPSPKEQQRIGDCLTSLDDLIAVETQKLNKLKTHKKGLMQQLFPAADGDDA